MWASSGSPIKKPRGAKGGLTFENNTFVGADGVALEYAGKNVLLKNNLFEYNDWYIVRERRLRVGVFVCGGEGAGGGLSLSSVSNFPRTQQILPIATSLLIDFRI